MGKDAIPFVVLPLHDVDDENNHLRCPPSLDVHDLLIGFHLEPMETKHLFSVPFRDLGIRLIRYKIQELEYSKHYIALQHEMSFWRNELLQYLRPSDGSFGEQSCADVWCKFIESLRDYSKFALSCQGDVQREASEAVLHWSRLLPAESNAGNSGSCDGCVKPLKTPYALILGELYSNIAYLHISSRETSSIVSLYYRLAALWFTSAGQGPLAASKARAAFDAWLLFLPLEEIESPYTTYSLEEVIKMLSLAVRLASERLELPYKMLDYLVAMVVLRCWNCGLDDGHPCVETSRVAREFKIGTRLERKLQDRVVYFMRSRQRDSSLLLPRLVFSQGVGSGFEFTVIGPQGEAHQFRCPYGLGLGYIINVVDSSRAIKDLLARYDNRERVRSAAAVEWYKELFAQQLYLGDTLGLFKSFIRFCKFIRRCCQSGNSYGVFWTWLGVVRGLIPSVPKLASSARVLHQAVLVLLCVDPSHHTNLALEMLEEAAELFATEASYTKKKLRRSSSSSLKFFSLVRRSFDCIEEALSQDPLRFSALYMAVSISLEFKGLDRALRYMDSFAAATGTNAGMVLDRLYRSRSLDEYIFLDIYERMEYLPNSNDSSLLSCSICSQEEEACLYPATPFPSPARHVHHPSSFLEVSGLGELFEYYEELPLDNNASSCSINIATIVNKCNYVQEPILPQDQYITEIEVASEYDPCQRCQDSLQQAHDPIFEQHSERSNSGYNDGGVPIAQENFPQGRTKNSILEPSMIIVTFLLFLVFALVASELKSWMHQFEASPLPRGNRPC